MPINFKLNNENVVLIFNESKIRTINIQNNQDFNFQRIIIKTKL